MLKAITRVSRHGGHPHLQGLLRCALPLAALLASMPVSRVAADPVSTQIQVPGRTITSSGEAVVYVVPDEAVVSFGVETFDADLDKSKSKNDEASSRLIKAIKALNIEEKHIQTDTMQVEIRYYGNNYQWRGNNYAQNAAQVAPGGGGEEGGTMPLGQMGVHATVGVSFDLIADADKP
jgi:hypothetical protein